MSCGCKNKNNGQQQVQTVQTQQAQQAQQTESVKNGVQKVVEKYYNKK
jgi:hypothetical protein